MRHRARGLTAAVGVLVTALAMSLVGMSVGVGVGVGVGTASAAPAATRTVAAPVTVHDGPDGKHEATIDTTLYLPPTATAAHPAPAVLVTHGFGGSKDDASVVRWARYLAGHGYVVLTWTAQGFGASSGCIRLDDVYYDVRDVSQLIDRVLAPRAEVLSDARGPVVGMVGESYAGGIQPLVAEFDSRVRAIVPFWAWNSLQHALMPNDRIVPGDRSGFALQAPKTGVFKAEWTTELFAAGNAQPLQGNGGCPQEKAGSDPAGAAACPGFPTALCQVYATTAATGSPDETGRHLVALSSGATWIDQLTAPTLLVQGERDTLFPLNEAVATYTSLRARHVPAAMIWSSDGHGGYPGQPGEGTFGSTDLEHGYVSHRVLTWFDRFLRHAPVDPGPGFAYYRDWTTNDGHGSNAEQYAAARTFPAQHTAAYLLSGGAGNSGSMVPPGLAADPGTFDIFRDGLPSYSETSNCTGPAAGSPCPGSLGGIPAEESPGTWAAWTSPAFSAPVESVGVPTAHVHLSHANGQDLIVFAKVYDVAPDGTTVLIGRQVAPVRVPGGQLAHAVDIRLPAMAHLFAKGHAVRFALSASDAAYSLGLATATPDKITVQFGSLKDYGSSPYGQIKRLDYDPDMSSFALPVGDQGKVQPWYGKPAAAGLSLPLPGGPAGLVPLALVAGVVAGRCGRFAAAGAGAVRVARRSHDRGRVPRPVLVA